MLHVGRGGDSSIQGGSERIEWFKVLVSCKPVSYIESLETFKKICFEHRLLLLWKS